MYKKRCERGEGKDRNEFVKNAFFHERKSRLHDEEIEFPSKIYWSYGESSYSHAPKNRVSEVICVENDAKADARCHTLKIDLRYLKCTKIDAKEKEEKEKKKEKIGMNLLKSHFFDDRKNRLHDEETKLSNQRYGSYGNSSHSHDTKNLIPMNQKIV